MKKIQAHQCEFCDKILKSYSGMWRHEKICFYNPDTKSCISCAHLRNEIEYDGRILTYHEKQVLNHEVRPALEIIKDNDPDAIEDIEVLNEDHIYLYESEPCNYCTRKKQIMNRLTTNCGIYENKPISA